MALFDYPVALGYRIARRRLEPTPNWETINAESEICCTLADNKCIRVARIYPSFEKIATLNPRPEPGELHLLNALSALLDDSCEIYFQPFLNGDRPDIIIVRENYGVFIIEVKDWNLNHYDIDNRKKWRIRHNGAPTKSPLEQVLRYKENLYNLHIEKLLERKIKDYRYWQIVGCGVYFHNATMASITQKLIEPFGNDNRWRYDVELMGSDSLESTVLTEILTRKYILGTRPSFLFDNALYKSFVRYLQPIIHSQDGDVQLSEAQERLATSKENISQRISGFVGSGKTTVIASRAVKALQRHRQRVLILCYNITLRNYIHDKISKVRATFDWNMFYITNYHNFISAEMNNVGIPFELPENFDQFTQAEKSHFFENYFSNPDLFVDHQDALPKYNTIIIDEIQDYPIGWMEMIKENFLAPDGEYLIVGDEKQNIFGLPLENKDLVTNVHDDPLPLLGCFRFGDELTVLATDFQAKYFAGKYKVDNLTTTVGKAKENRTFSLKNKKAVCIKYLPLPQSTKATPLSIYTTVMEYMPALNEQPNNATVLGFRIGILREFDCYYRYKTGEQTNAMFETQEVWYRLFLDTFRKQEIIERGVTLFRDNSSADRKKNRLAVLLAINDLFQTNRDLLFEKRREILLMKYRINPAEFDQWYADNHLSDLLNRDKQKSLRQMERDYPQYRQLTQSIKTVRDNKKTNFWYERGTLKLSTIHSFKGWETNTLFLVLEEEFDDSDFQDSFEELIYTAITRSRQNLIVLNYGNSRHHNEMLDLFGKYQ